MLAIAAGFLALAWHVLAGGGWTPWEALILLCLAANAPWLALSAATGLVGFAIRRVARDPAGLVLPALRAADRPVRARTVLALCVRLEDMACVLPPAARLLAALRAGEGGDGFALAVLSDTPAGAAAEAEAAAVRDLAARFPPGVVLYRRRQENAGWKAGNLMEFLDGDLAAGFDLALALDADSAMSADAVRRLARIMAAAPRIAILQPTVGGHGARTPFARITGLGHARAVRIWATGQAWWQGPHGPYWGHNAMIRIAPFRAHARLPILPCGGRILSHDHVEAALLQGAGWEVRVLPEDAGSAERHPPDLPALLARDARWAAGNMQYRHLLRRRDMGAVGRLQMLQAILHYLLVPLWFAPLPIAAANAATGGGEGTPRGALVALLLLSALLLHLPKLLGHAEALWRAPRAAVLRAAAGEVAFGFLLDPLLALDRTLLLLRGGRAAGWAPQRRDAAGIGQRAALRRFAPHTVAGLLLLGLFLAAGPFATLVALPALAGLLLAAPLAALSSRPAGAGVAANGKRRCAAG